MGRQNAFWRLWEKSFRAKGLTGACLRKPTSPAFVVVDIPVTLIILKDLNSLSYFVARRFFLGGLHSFFIVFQGHLSVIKDE